MKSIINYLDDLKEITGSDYKTAKLLNLTKEAVSKIRIRGQTGDETAIKMADALGVERDELLISAAIARSTGEVKTAWEKIGKLSGIAASMAVVATVSFSVYSMAYDGNLLSDEGAIIYIMRSLITVSLLITTILVLVYWSSRHGSKKNKLLSHPK